MITCYTIQLTSLVFTHCIRENWCPIYYNYKQHSIVYTSFVWSKICHLHRAFQISHLQCSLLVWMLPYKTAAHLGSRQLTRFWNRAIITYYFTAKTEGGKKTNSRQDVCDGVSLSSSWYYQLLYDCLHICLTLFLQGWVWRRLLCWWWLWFRVRCCGCITKTEIKPVWTWTNHQISHTALRCTKL